MQTADYCREIESYLCQKNDGHLIRVVGPSFEIVSGWATEGVPLKVALRGIDRYFERYYAKGPRRRPVKIDFCEADVLDVFDEWRRALGLTAARQADSNDCSPGQSAEDAAAGLPRRSADLSAEARSAKVEGAKAGQSLPAHLERVVLRLTSARARGVPSAHFDDVIDGIARELDTARAESRGVRGAARQALITRLDALDAALLEHARAAMTDTMRQELEQEADADLAGFRASMAPDAFARTRVAAINRLVRERFGLPTIRYQQV